MISKRYGVVLACALLGRCLMPGTHPAWAAASPEDVMPDNPLIQQAVADLARRESVPPASIEVVSFGYGAQIHYLTGLGGEPVLRLHPDGTPFVTDHGNYILDCAFGPIEDLAVLVRRLDARAGIVEHGLFVNLASAVLVASGEGVRMLTPA